jgi:hypothetical protein
MRVDCAAPAFDTTRFDCGHNDYFHTNPTPGSYLATHWNAPYNSFLIAGSNGPVDPGLPPPPAPSVNDSPQPTIHDKKDKKKGKHGKKGENKKGSHNKKRH